MLGIRFVKLFLRLPLRGEVLSLGHTFKALVEVFNKLWALGHPDTSSFNFLI